MNDLRSRITELLALCEKATTGQWDIEDFAARAPEYAQAIAINASGQTLFDTLNRDYHLSGIERDMHDEDGRWHDTEGLKDIECATGLRNAFPSIAQEMLAVMEERDRLAAWISATKDTGR